MNVSNRRYTWIIMQAYAQRGDWSGLERLAGDGRKCPVAMEQFAELCFTYNRPQEAMKYINMINNKIVKCEMMFVAQGMLGIGRFQESLDAAKQVQNVEELISLKDRLDNKIAKNVLQQYLQGRRGWLKKEKE